MKKYSLIFLFLVGFIALFSACNDDDKYIPTPPVVSIESLSGVFAMPQEDSIILKAKVESPLETTLRWSVNGEETSTDSIYTFKMNDLGNYEVKLTATNADGEVSATTPVEVYGKYKYGTFILNEGATLRGDIASKLIFISPKGVITDSVYQKENNGEMLKLVSQDLFISNNKMYFISQRKALTITNAETLKKEIVYEDEIKDLVAPTHLVVLDDNIYIRDNKGVYLFKPSDKSLTFIEGSNGARKNTMALVDGKVFVSKGKSVVVIEKGKEEISHTIDFDGNVSGIIKSADKNLWVSDASGKISKVNVKDYSISQTNELPAEAAKLLTASYAAAPSISAKGDTLYVSALQSKIYRHIFSKNQTDLMVDAKEMVENLNLVYNTVAVNPLTGDVIMNSIKGYGDNIAVNNISIFDFSGNEPVLKANYKDYLRYPAGVFFTYNFE